MPTKIDKKKMWSAAAELFPQVDRGRGASANVYNVMVIFFSVYQHHNQIVLCCESQKYSDIHMYLVPKIQFEMESDVNIEPV